MKTIKKNVMVIILALFGLGIIGNNVLYATDEMKEEEEEGGGGGHANPCDEIWTVNYYGGFPGGVGFECTSDGSHICTPLCPWG